jgi:hypothetical protein
MIVNEIWKDVKGYEGLYQVSNLGNVKSKWKLLKPWLGKRGYLEVKLSKNGKTKTYKVHRLVAKAFLPEPTIDNPVINHINANKLDNRAENLERCTQTDNVKHAYSLGLVGRPFKDNEVIIKDLTTMETVVFQSMAECSRFFGYGRSWLEKRFVRHGNPFTYKNYEISGGNRL